MTATGSARPQHRASRVNRGLLLVGFLALAAAVAAASRAPASSYELSVYGATPVGFWAGVAVATVVAAAVAFRATAWPRGLALALGTGSMFALVALPLVRGYHFYGTADPMTHLGWTRQMAAGGLEPTQLIYPGLHTGTVVFSQLSGWPLRWSMLLVTASFTLLFVVFVALTVRLLAPDRPHALAVGAFSALLLLPVNHISVHLRTHPFSQTTLFSAFVVFALAAYVVRVDGRGFGALLSGEGLVLSVAAVASVFYHPQTAADLLLVFVAISAVQLLARRGRLPLDVRGHAPLYAPTAVFAVAYALWVLPASWFRRAVGLLYLELLVPLLQGRLPSPGESVASQSASLLAIGSGPAEIFLKLFVPTTVFLLLAALFVLGVATGRLGGREEARTVAGAYFVVASLVGAVFVVAYFAASISEMYFRHLGFLMVFVTVMGALALVHLTDGGTPGRPSRGATVALVAAFLVLVPLTAAVAYQSPYIYKANQHVTEQEMAGYEWTFESTPDGAAVAGIRAGPERFQDAVVGPTRATRPTPSLAGEELTSLGTALPGGSYVVVADRDVQRELVAYRGLRYSPEQYESLDRQPGVNKVHANGETRVLVVTDEAG